MRKNNKRALYESIMKKVAKTVKKALNESENDLFIRIQKAIDETPQPVIDFDDCYDQADALCYAEDVKYDYEDEIAQKLGFEDANEMLNALPGDPDDNEYSLFSGFTDEYARQIASMFTA